MDTSFLLQNTQFEGVPESQLEWFLANGEWLTLAPGDFVFEKGMPANNLILIKSGVVQAYFLQAGKQRLLAELKGGSITGVLPYSRMTHANGYGEVKETAEVFLLHRKHFPEMIRDHFELTRAFVHQMTNRVRDFTQSQLQNEKLMALGKLSAGLAHELNNPSSAIVRSSQALKQHLELLPGNFKKVIKIKVTDEEIDQVNQLLFDRINQERTESLSLMDKSDLEDELGDWLEGKGVQDGFEMAENLVEFGFREKDLEKVMELVSEAHFPPVMKWIDDNLTTDKMVLEIEEAACRISDLVQSVKGYTHMDQASTLQEVDLHKGLLSTQTMLNHKAKQSKVTILNDFQESLPTVMGYPGEINQVFTNLIDNALDAMEKTGGTLTTKTWQDGKFVRIHITDAGTGIPDDIIRKIFDPFFTTKEMGKGTGLGLEVVYKIVTKHQGIIEVESEPGRTTFKLCFPIEH